ncbi:DUF1674 domain-containing protein [Methylobacterium durans]|uniref:DUF1674 domain-containing protein n=2 Tax=Methylobacterium durans TaxID=2202825 RepID=A0A2U8W8A4_9HYPH|nr:DUF1674 domain-containing protein [Methylobacterium durans]
MQGTRQGIRQGTRDTDASGPAEAASPKRLTPAAERALSEAAERRAAIDARAAEIAARRERQGRGGLEPVRYDDWEVKGIAVDF